MKIGKKSDIQEVASIVCDCLLRENIQAVLSGGAVVSIYTANEYESKDLDFISSEDIKKIEKALVKIDFQKSSGRYFTHPHTQYFVEFPKPPLAIGGLAIKEWVTQNNKAGRLLILSPTHSVMDRLAGYFYWNDKQNLDQAIMVAKKHPIKMNDIEQWAMSEGELEKFEVFRDSLSTERNRSAQLPPRKPTPPVHPWRACPYGEHWVKTHPLHIPPSHAYPDGHLTTRHAHCAHNPSGKDQLYPDEIREIAKQYFAKVKNKPCSLKLNFGAAGSKYDQLIAGWVQYWNEVLNPDTSLDSNLVKALIATESSFDPNQLANKKNSNSARGLTQITNDTRKILGDDDGELKDHFITVTKEDLNDPGVNICAGVRWLFQKRKLAAARLKHAASWTDAIQEYKGAFPTSDPRHKKIMDTFNHIYEKYKKCEKN